MKSVNSVLKEDKLKVQQSQDVLSITLPMIHRMKVEQKSKQTIKSYVRAVERLVRFHDIVHPKEMDIDEVYDFLACLSEKHQVNWRTSKMYVAGLRYYWTHIFWLINNFINRLTHPHLMMRFPHYEVTFSHFNLS